MSPKLGSHNKVLSAARNESTTETIPLLPATGWQKFLSGTNPKGFCYGRIYEHIIQTAQVYQKNANNSDSEEDNLTDFNNFKTDVKGLSVLYEWTCEEHCKYFKGQTFLYKSKCYGVIYTESDILCFCNSCLNVWDSIRRIL